LASPIRSDTEQVYPLGEIAKGYWKASIEKSGPPFKGGGGVEGDNPISDSFKME
jgi:hypothetical protein